MSKLLIVVIDGCAPSYLSPRTTPNMLKLAAGENGFYTTIQAAVPTVTNVNHATILSGSFPEEHGVVGNYYYNRENGEQGFIELADFMQAETILDMYHHRGLKTALLTVKGKVMEVFGQHVDIGINLEKPDPVILKDLKLSDPPAVQSLDANNWIFEACYKCIVKEDPELVYCTTNDFVMHHFAPESPVATEQMKIIDHWIGKLYDLDPRREIYITADHGMNPKTTIVNLQHILDDAGFKIVCHPPLKDRYLENHIYQEGGTLYLYFKEPGNDKALLDFLAAQQSIEKILIKEKAAAEYHLPSDNIGDYVVFAKKDYAFGEVEGYELQVKDVRTHGSLHEQEVPLIAANASAAKESYLYSKDIVKNILDKG